MIYELETESGHNIDYANQRLSGKYIVESSTAGMLLSMYPNKCKIRPLDGENPQNASHVIVIYPHGLGDMIMLRPILKDLKKDGKMLLVSTTRENATLIDDICESLPYPLSADYANNAHILDFDNVLRFDHRAMFVPSIDILADSIGIRLTDDEKRNGYKREFSDDSMVSLSLPAKTSKKRVGVQLNASAKCRDYPWMDELLSVLSLADIELFLWRNEDRALQEILRAEHVVDVMSIYKPSPADTLRIVGTCDLIITPDSFLLHAAAAMDVPCLSLHGSFHADVRARYYHKNVSLQGDLMCQNCQWYPLGFDEFPPNMACSTSGKCLALGKIDPNKILDTAFKMLMGEKWV
jgi:ADP-heptose:LPS heptosyltransferase